MKIILLVALGLVAVVGVIWQVRINRKEKEEAFKILNRRIDKFQSQQGIMIVQKTGWSKDKKNTMFVTLFSKEELQAEYGWQDKEIHKQIFLLIHHTLDEFYPVPADTDMIPSGLLAEFLVETTMEQS